MSSYTKVIGDIGVSVVISEFLKHGISVLLPYDDNSPYDIVIYVNDEFYKIQVKTTEKVRYDGTQMNFDVTKSNPYSKIDPKYIEGEVDYFAFYCIENEWCGMFGFDEYKSQVTFRLKPPNNNQKDGIKFAKDYLFHDQVVKFFNKDYIKNNIVHTEKDKKKKTYNQKRHMKLCPECNQKMIRLKSNMCRDCYNKSVVNNKINDDNVIKVNNNLKDLCPVCNKNYKSINSEMCEVCRFEKRKIPKIEKEKLELLIYELSFSNAAKQCNVGTSTIRRWCKFYNLPTNKKDMKPIETN